MEVESGEKQCPRCKGKKVEADGSNCTLCDGKGKVSFTRVGDNEIINKKKARFVG